MLTDMWLAGAGLISARGWLIENEYYYQLME